jgi:hypothetical protein
MTKGLKYQKLFQFHSSLVFEGEEWDENFSADMKLIKTECAENLGKRLQMQILYIYVLALVYLSKVTFCCFLELRTH